MHLPFRGTFALCILPWLAAPLAAVDFDGVQIHGFVSQGYLLTTETDWFGSTQDPGTFEFSEVAINVSTQPVERLRIGLQLVARDFADSGDNSVEVDWAFADWRATERAGLKVGRIKMPYGLYNESRDLDFDHATVFLPQVIYLPQLRDYTLAINGAMLYGGLKPGTAGQLDGVVFGGGQNAREDGDLANYLTDLGAGDRFTDIHVDAVAGAVVTWLAPLDGLRMRLSGVGFWGFSADGQSEAVPIRGSPGVNADLDISTKIDQFYSGVASIEYQRQGLILAAEYLLEYGKTDTSVTAHPYTFVPGPLPGSTIRVELPEQPSQRSGYTRTEAMYAAASYRMLDRYELSLSRQLSFADRENPSKKYDRSWALAGRYDIFANWLVKAEWQYHSGNALDTGNDKPEHWTVFALKTTVDF
mgnify:CR=1 FL=1